LGVFFFSCRHCWHENVSALLAASASSAVVRAGTAINLKTRGMMKEKKCIGSSSIGVLGL